MCGAWTSVITRLPGVAWVLQHPKSVTGFFTHRSEQEDAYSSRGILSVNSIGSTSISLQEVSVLQIDALSGRRLWNVRFRISLGNLRGQCQRQQHHDISTAWSSPPSHKGGSNAGFFQGLVLMSLGL
jgi:hypothetical protein